MNELLDKIFPEDPEMSEAELDKLLNSHLGTLAALAAQEELLPSGPGNFIAGDTTWYEDY